ncbi:hypothetical protein PEC301645_27160 [Pectobacterium carotovorum subsp. carotovorum]|jgi:hypothetical protein|nr:hypothetical protein PEC301645_27160 [Pectobacterium carotovorum subsp. carotovorum]
MSGQYTLIICLLHYDNIARRAGANHGAMIILIILSW